MRQNTMQSEQKSRTISTALFVEKRSCILARKNFQFEKRQKELAKQKKREAKLRKKREKNEPASDEDAERNNASDATE